jgi:hypothetical protein
MIWMVIIQRAKDEQVNRIIVKKAILNLRLADLNRSAIKSLKFREASASDFRWQFILNSLVC